MKDNIKKEKIQLFEREYTFTGKHAVYLKFLTNEAKIYASYIDIFISAAVVGFFYKKTAMKDNTIDATARIQSDAFTTHRESCLFIYRLITLLDGDNLSEEERVNRAFRYDSDPEMIEVVKKTYERFFQYVRGGIEWLYDNFTSGCTSREDYIIKSMKVLNNFKNEMNGINYEEELKRFMGK